MAARTSALKGRTVNVVDGTRTPFLKTRSGPGAFLSSDLAVAAGRNLLQRQPFEAADLDEVILGCVMPGPDEVNIARVVALRLGCGKRVPAWTVQRNCASGMQALDSAAKDIASGRADLVLAGGTEAMSHAPVLFGRAMVRWLATWYAAKSLPAYLNTLVKLRPAYLKPIIGLLRGLTDPVVGLSMGQTAEVLAHRFNITREQMDGYALRSHERLASAQDQGLLGEVEVIFDDQGHYHQHDDGLRRDSDMGSLAKLRPVFDRQYGRVTAGNSAQITDGAAWLILASDKAVKQHQLPVLGRITDCEWAGLDPAQMGLGPVHASTPILKRHRLGLGDIDYWEINEAFAAQVQACLAAWRDKAYCKEELGSRSALGELDEDRLNVDGGAVAIGHPIGATGARIVLHIIKLLERNNAKRGIATLCIGGGQGGAMMLERDCG